MTAFGRLQRNITKIWGSLAVGLINSHLSHRNLSVTRLCFFSKDKYYCQESGIYLFFNPVGSLSQWKDPLQPGKIHKSAEQASEKVVSREAGVSWGDGEWSKKSPEGKTEQPGGTTCSTQGLRFKLMNGEAPLLLIQHSFFVVLLKSIHAG